MFLSEKATDAILSSLALRCDIGKELSRSEDRIRRLAQMNDRNNDLTKYSALKIIQTETGMELGEVLVDERPVPALSK